MDSANPVLLAAAKDGTLAPSDWPATLDTILSRLDDIFYNVFPAPSIIPPPPPHILPSSKPEPSSQESQTADKENAPPSTPPQRPPVPTFERPPDVEPSPAPSATTTTHKYPPELIAFLETIKTTLKKEFPNNPPYTIQRLAEIISSPRAHYKYLYQFLRAVDRIVSVTSPSTIFPLPQTGSNSTDPLTNGVDSSTTANPSNTLGSDESLGGALLTPIPWLRPERSSEDGSQPANGGASQNEFVSEHSEMIDGPNGAGRIETVTVTNGTLSSSPAPTTSTSNEQTPTISTESLRASGAVTQGELLRQEQEAGVVPVSQTNPIHQNPHSHAHPHPQNILPSNAPSETPATSTDPSEVPSVAQDPAEDTKESDERPHARGPEAIGMEDTGPQSARGTELDIAAAVGRPAASSTSPELQKLRSPEPEPREAIPSASNEESSEIEMTDADAEGEGEPQAAALSPELAKDKKDDGDTVIADVDGLTEDDKDKMVEEGDGKGADAVDTSTIT